ncbi:MAG: hypothetical protein H0T89_21470 [Deltaproteobacteria bacterium]|nr:hypothetical protein [Deltaproteobacteria bacterium]MDQ3297399.1 hypothetical protein [Myxococcota bacterium]
MAFRFHHAAVALLMSVAALAACKKPAPKETAGSGSAPVSGSAVAPVAAVFANEWNVYAHNDRCVANQHHECPPDVACDPPPPREVECPPAAAEGANVRVVELADKTCATAPADCKSTTCAGAKTPCPLPAGEALPPLVWAVTAMADGTCTATWSTASAGTKSATIKCPAAGVATMYIRRADRTAPCSAEPKPGVKLDVPCPVEPKQLTVAQLREAYAKDKASVEAQRVRITGFAVFAMGGSTIAKKVTTYSVGASDTKDDAKIAIKCFSPTKPPDVAGGDPLMIEGTVKGTTPDDLVLVDCTADRP